MKSHISQAGNVDTENIGHCGGTADDGCGARERDRGHQAGVMLFLAWANRQQPMRAQSSTGWVVGRPGTTACSRQVREGVIQERVRSACRRINRGEGCFTLIVLLGGVRETAYRRSY